MQRYILNAQ